MADDEIDEWQLLDIPRKNGAIDKVTDKIYSKLSLLFNDTQTVLKWKVKQMNDIELENYILAA